MHRSTPRRIKVCGVWFKIEYVHDLKNSAGEALYGDCSGAERVIRLCTSLNSSPEHFENTLLHETIHAILYVSGHSQFLEDSKEEAMVIALETGLSSIYGRKR